MCSAVIVWVTQKLVSFGLVFLRKLQISVQFGFLLYPFKHYVGLKLLQLKTKIPFDNGLFVYHLTTVEIMLWDMNDNKLTPLLYYSQLFVVTLCNFIEYLVKLCLCFDIVNILEYYMVSLSTHNFKLVIYCKSFN